MKRRWKRILSLLLSALLAVSCTGTAFAAFSDFTDVRGHWAQATLEKAYGDGILNGYDARTMAPNDSVTTAQAVTILCRVLHATDQADLSAWKLPADAWYAGSLAKGVALGLLDNVPQTVTDPIARKDAFVLFARAFQLTPAAPDLSVLAQFPDAGTLTGEAQNAAAALVADKVVSGSEGQLLPDRSLTRAEFVTILYRLAGQYAAVSNWTGGETGAVLSGDGTLSQISGGSLWLDCSASQIALNDLSADRVVVRSANLTGLSIAGTGKIDRLVLANGKGDVTLKLPDTASLGTFTVGQGSGAAALTGSVSQVEVTGDNRTVTLNSNADALLISGTGNTVTLSKGCKVTDIFISGAGNTLKLDGQGGTMVLSARDNTVTGSGRLDKATLLTRYYKMTVSANSVTKWANYGLDTVKLSLTAPDKLEAGETLQAAANLSLADGDKGKVCTGTWYLNGEQMQQQTITLGKDTPVSSFVPNYTHSLQQNAKLTFTLSYQNTDGDTLTKSADASLYLDTFADLGLADTTVKVTVPETVQPGEAIQATAEITSPEHGKTCTATWLVNGKQVAAQQIILGKDQPTLSYPIQDYYYGMPETGTVKCTLSYTTADGRAQSVSGEAAATLVNFPDNGIAHAAVTLNVPDTLAAGTQLRATAKVSYLQGGKSCTGKWYIDGSLVSTQTVVLGTDTPSLAYSFSYTEDMKTSATVKFVLDYTTADGRAQEISAVSTLALQNYGYAHYHPAEAVNTVTSGYLGDYTLQWALSNDYTPEMKSAWVNAKGYASNTKYLIWVNLTYQRVNIFAGYQGNWYLTRSCLCGSGKSSTPTIRGVFTTSYKQSAWSYGSYYCGPVVRFNGSSGYAFHSRLEYFPMNSDRYYDARIGFPISHGCLRMYNDDIWWIYNNIPNGTTVVVY